MATGAEHLIRKITLEADELAKQYNRTRDPSIRDQWYKLLKQVPPASASALVEAPSRKRT